MRILIIGAGIAGISLSRHLSLWGQDFKVVYASEWPSSTVIATGLINPIVFKRVNKSWKVDELLPYAKDFYHSLQSLLNFSLIKDVNIEKIVPSAEYESLWQKRLDEPGMSVYINEIKDRTASVKESILVDCQTLVSAFRKSLENEGLLDSNPIKYSELCKSELKFEFRGERYDKVVFCEGSWGATNPMFEYLPWKLSKGEWIVVKAEIDLKDRILNDAVSIIPLGDQQFKISSTFEWETLDWNPSDLGKAILEKAFRKIFNAPYVIVDHQAGIRPTVADRRPFLGEHPERKGIFIFNGLGTKGLLLAPYFGNEMTEHLIVGKKLNKEVDIDRFAKRFYR